MPFILPMLVRVLVAFLCCGAVATAVSGQVTLAQEPLPARLLAADTLLEIPDPTDWDSRFEEMRQWIDDYGAWKAWSDQWRGKQQQGWFGVRERRVEPAPPAWLSAECRDLLVGEGLFGKACDLLAEWEDDYATGVVRSQLAAARAQREAPTKTQWWEHVHFDLAWPMTQVGSGGTAAFGVVGMHATVDLKGRFQVFVAPGAMLMNLPTTAGTRQWKPATDWGFSYRLMDFSFPGSDRRASLNVNIAKAWVLFGKQGLLRTTANFAGFSITFKKDPRAPGQ